MKNHFVDLYSMKLHEMDILNNRETVTRVPGGWIYTYVSDSGGASSVFVPFDNEFQNAKESK